MKLADSNIDNKSLAIGILVVAKFYWEVMLERFIKGKSSGNSSGKNQSLA